MKLKKIIAIVIAVVVVAVLSVVVIHAVGSDNIELPEADTSTTESSETEPETTEAVATEPIITESETTPPLETEPDVTEPVGVRADESFVGYWHQSASSGISLESVQGDKIEFQIFGQTLHHLRGTASFDGDRYYFNDEDVQFINYMTSEFSDMPVSGYLMFTGDELLTFIKQGDYSTTFECKYLITTINPSLGNNFITGTYEQVTERFPEYPISHKNEYGDMTTHITFNDDMTMHLDVYANEGWVKINGTYEIMQAKDDPIFDAEIEKGHVSNGENYVAVVTINEDDLGTVQMPTKFYFRVYNRCVYLNMFDTDYSYSWGNGAIVISGAYDMGTDTRFIEENSYHQVGRVNDEF